MADVREYQPFALPELVPNDVIISFDPGITTGVCVVRYTAKPSVYGLEVLYSGEVKWADRWPRIKELLAKASSGRKGRLARVVIEDFVLYQNKAKDLIGHGFPSPEVIGVIKTYCYEMDLLPLIVEQLAAVRKSVQVLKDHRDKLAPGQHCLDAYQHARYRVVVDVNAQRSTSKKRKKP